MAVSQPDITINITPADVNISNEPQRVLFVGQMTSAGTATAGELVQRIENNNQQDTLFGENSMLAKMIRDAKRINKVTRFDAIPLNDAGGATSATAEIVFSGTATEAGTLYITVGSYENHRYTLDIASGDTATEIGDALEALINADTKAPATSSNTTGTVTLTAVNGGVEGNAIGLRVEGKVAGVTVTMSGFTDGATNPTLTNIFDVIEGQRYQTIVWPSSYDINVVKDFLDSHFNVTNDVLDGQAITAYTDTYSNLVTTAEALNSQCITILGNKTVNDLLWKGPALLELNTSYAAQVAAIRALRLTKDANIAQYVISVNGARDSFGGPALASLPYFNTPFPYLPLIEVGKGFTREEIKNFVDVGVSVLGNNIANNQVIAGEFVTTYKTDSAGNPDPSFKYLNYVDTISNAREYLFNNLRRRFAQCRLTEGDLVPNRAIANKQVIESYLDSLFIDLGSEDYVLAQRGEQARKYFRQNRSVSLDMVEGKVTINMKLPIVVQLRTIISTLQISFSTES